MNATWTTADDHLVVEPAAQAIVAQFVDLLAGEPTYTDNTAVDGTATIERSLT